MITNINVKNISPHPDNPRKDLGDLTELAASIKAQGILQNLTVVPKLAMKPGYCTSCKIYNSVVGKCKSDHDRGGKPPCSKWDVRDDFVFTVIIGHRRLAAAKLAGLEEVPCVISDMDQKQQIATMLLENIQRTDLTVWEQATGFQTLLNFGETVDTVAEMTGFSESTVRRRMKLLELDGDKFKQSVARGATLADYAELDKISSVDLKNKVLEKIGTADFQWALREAVAEEKREKNRAAVVAEVEKFATEVKDDKELGYQNGYRQYKWYSLDTPGEITPPADADKQQYYFHSSARYVTVYTKVAATTPQPAGPSAEEQQLRERRHRDYAGRKGDAPVIMEMALRAIMTGDSYYNLAADMCVALGIEIPEPQDEDDCDDEEVMVEAEITEAFKASPERVLFAAAYLAVEDDRANCHNWQCEHQGNAELDALYDTLEKLGYQVSAEERALMDGTHELYTREAAAS